MILTMKRHILYIAITIVTLASCTVTGTLNDDFKRENEIITTKMKTDKAGLIEFSAAGEGIMTIDWGDGTTLQKVEISSSDPKKISHTYSTSEFHTITMLSGKSLERLFCSGIGITEIDLKQNTELVQLFCNNNQIETLDVSDNTKLIKLQCSDNKISQLNLNPELNLLDCSQNKLSSLELQNHSQLSEIDCSNNELTGLKLGNNKVLHMLLCNKNNLSDKALNDILNELHDENLQGVSKKINISENPGTDACNLRIAENKGWDIE
jgi:hypothetical protein